MYYVIEEEFSGQHHFFWDPSNNRRSFATNTVIGLQEKHLRWTSDNDVILSSIILQLPLPDSSDPEELKRIFRDIYPELHI